MNKEILKLAIPNIISNLSVPLLSIVDVALMGHLESAHFILAVGFGTSLFNFLYWGFGFLRMGTTGVTAQAFGGRNFRETSYIFFRAIFIAIAAGLTLILFQSALLKLGLALFDTTPNVEESLIRYYRVRIYAAPATLSMYVIIGWFLGMQNAKVPMALTIAINSVNIFGSFYCVQYLGMKADGVALGTVVAQYTGLILGGLLLLKKHKVIATYFSWKQILDLVAIKSFLRLNLDIIIRTLCLIFTLAFFKIHRGHRWCGKHSSPGILHHRSLWNRRVCFRCRVRYRQIFRRPSDQEIEIMHRVMLRVGDGSGAIIYRHFLHFRKSYFTDDDRSGTGFPGRKKLPCMDDLLSGIDGHTVYLGRGLYRAHRLPRHEKFDVNCHRNWLSSRPVFPH